MKIFASLLVLAALVAPAGAFADAAAPEAAPLELCDQSPAPIPSAPSEPVAMSTMEPQYDYPPGPCPGNYDCTVFNKPGYCAYEWRCPGCCVAYYIAPGAACPNRCP